MGTMFGVIIMGLDIWLFANCQERLGTWYSYCKDNRAQIGYLWSNITIRR